MNEKYTNLKFLAPVLVMAIIFVLSHQPQLPHNEIVPYYDKFLHVIAYAILAAAWVFTLKRNTEDRRGNLHIFAAAMALALIYGVSDEYHQFFIPGRSCEAGDVLADGVGALIGAWIWVSIKPAKKGGAQPPSEEK